MATTTTYAVPADLLDAARQVAAAAGGSTTMLNVTGLDLPDSIAAHDVGTTRWAPTADVANWVEAGLALVHPCR